MNCSNLKHRYDISFLEKLRKRYKVEEQNNGGSFFWVTHLDKYKTWIECRSETFYYLFSEAICCWICEWLLCVVNENENTWTSFNEWFIWSWIVAIYFSSDVNRLWLVVVSFDGNTFHLPTNFTHNDRLHHKIQFFLITVPLRPFVIMLALKNASVFLYAAVVQCNRNNKEEGIQRIYWFQKEAFLRNSFSTLKFFLDNRW